MHNLSLQESLPNRFCIHGEVEMGEMPASLSYANFNVWDGNPQDAYRGYECPVLALDKT